MTIVAIRLLDRTGRRPLLIGGTSELGLPKGEMADDTADSTAGRRRAWASPPAGA